MTETVFAADPTRLLIAAAVGIVLLLVLIIKFKIHPVLSLLISALFIGLGAGMPAPTLVNTVEKGAGETLQGIVLLIGLGSLFGGILEVSGGAQCVAQTLINKFGESKAGIALGITGLVVGTTVFFEAGVVILIPLAFGLALEKSGLPLVLVAFLIAALIRASVGAAVVAMTMAAGIMAVMPGIADLSPVYLAAMVCAINGGATAFSHVNDSGFWLVSSLLEIDEKTTLKSWTIMETIVGLTGLVCAIVISLFA